jgi:hypothetical protein
VALSFAFASLCQAQTTYPPAGYPPTQQSQQFQQFQTQAPAHPMRTLFAQSLAQVVQTGGSAAVVAVADGLTGALKSWFDNRRQRKGQNGALGQNNYPAPAQMPMTTSGYPQTAYPPANGGAPDNNYPASNYPAPNYPDPNYPSTGNPDGGMPNASYPQANGYPQPDAYPQSNPYPSQPGTYPSQPNYPSQPAYPPPAPPAPQIYAGIAYEIHLLQPDGSTQPVDTASYAFRTGDQFRVYYRPSLPGRVDVFNVNAAGQSAQIDSSVVAAGDLASLGPYQFTDSQGEETLVLKLSPCVTPQLYATTRSIVKVQGTQPGNNRGGNSMGPNPMGLADCSNTQTRGLKTKTRDIRKVSVEGGTTFALDPIAPAEFGGDMSPRQVTITLHHR